MPQKSSEASNYEKEKWYHLEKDEYVYLLAPAVVGFGSSFICPIGNKAGNYVPARPPSYIFIIVWTLIYAILGIVWVWIRRIINETDCLQCKFSKILCDECNKERECEILKLNIMMVSNILCQLAWVYFYGCLQNKKYALYAIFINIIISLITLEFILKFNEYAGYLFTPYVGWLLYAFNLNMTEVNMQI